MNQSDMNQEEQRFADMLHAVRSGSPQPDEGFLDALKAKSTQAFLSDDQAQPAGAQKQHVKTFKKLIPMAIAACAIVAFSAWLLLPNGELAQSAYAEIAAAVENSASTPMVHVLETRDVRKREHWMFFQPYRRITKHANGVIEYMDLETRRHYRYEPRDKKITIDYEDGEWEWARSLSCFDLIVRGIELARRKGGRITKSSTKLNGQNLTVFVMTEMYGGGKESTMRVVVDPETERLVQFEALHGEELLQRMSFEYPNDGPADMYAAGVPRDAAIVDVSPSEEVDELFNEIETAKARFLSKFAAIECSALHSFDGSVPKEPTAVITVSYWRGDRGRQELYPAWVSATAKPHAEQLRILRDTIPAESIDGLRGWLRGRRPGRIIISDKYLTCRYVLDPEGDLSSDNSNFFDPRFDVPPVVKRSWRLDVPWDALRRDVTTSVGRWGELAGLEGRWARHPGARHPNSSYNPSRDYICERFYNPDDLFTLTLGPG